MNATLWSFGKHRGQSTNKIGQINPTYFDWIVKQPNMECRWETNEAKLWILAHADDPLTGNLTKRIERIMRWPQEKRNLMKENVNINHLTQSIFELNLNQETLNKIKYMHSKEPKYCGIFLDYFIRRELAIHQNEIINDTRCEQEINRKDILFLSPSFDQKDVDDVKDKYDDVKAMWNFCDLYKAFCNKLIPTEKVINEIILVSCTHSMCFQDDNITVEKVSQLLNLFHLTKDDCKNMSEFLNSFILLVSTKTKPKILFNPTLGNDKIGADADLIIDSTIVDIKVTINQCSEKNMLQLLGYVALAQKRGIYTNKICILNILTSTCDIYDISKWEKTHEFYELLVGSDQCNKNEKRQKKIMTI